MSLNKKVTKEVSIGEGVELIAAALKATLPYVPLPARIAGKLYKVSVHDWCLLIKPII